VLVRRQIRHDHGFSRPSLLSWRTLRSSRPQPQSSSTHRTWPPRSQLPADVTQPGWRFGLAQRVATLLSRVLERFILHPPGRLRRAACSTSELSRNPGTTSYRFSVPADQRPGEALVAADQPGEVHPAGRPCPHRRGRPRKPVDTRFPGCPGQRAPSRPSTPNT